MLGSNLTSAALRCKYELGVGAVNVELSPFAVFLSFNKYFIFQEIEGVQGDSSECPIPKYLVALLYLLY